MKRSTIILALGLGLAGSGSAMAEQFYNCVGGDFNGDGNACTQNVDQYGISWNASSTYTDSNNNGVVDVGETVVDSGSGGVDSLLLGGVPLTEISGGDTENYGTNWGLTFSYNDLTGTVAYTDGGSGILASYTSGTINVYYSDTLGATNVLALTIDISSSTGTIGNFLLYGDVTYAASNLFYFADNSEWSSLLGAPVTIAARIDTNVDTNVVPSPCGTGFLCRNDVTLNGSVEFARVPEPGTVALLGMGLLGLGLSRRRTKKAG